jgi:hypothetical protein
LNKRWVAGTVAAMAMAASAPQAHAAAGTHGRVTKAVAAGALTRPAVAPGHMAGVAYTAQVPVFLRIATAVRGLIGWRSTPSTIPVRVVVGAVVTPNPVPKGAWATLTARACPVLERVPLCALVMSARVTGLDYQAWTRYPSGKWVKQNFWEPGPVVWVTRLRTPGVYVVEVRALPQTAVATHEWQGAFRLPLVEFVVTAPRPLVGRDRAVIS